MWLPNGLFYDASYNSMKLFVGFNLSLHHSNGLLKM